MYRETTRAIQVTVEPSFVEDESAPDEGRYFWAYRVEISNLGEEVVRLRSRHWRITDANGRTEEVRGAGVVGKQPVLKPGETFAYTSGCPLLDAVGHHGGQLPDAEREGRDVLGRHSRLLARPARRGAGGELNVPAPAGGADGAPRDILDHFGIGADALIGAGGQSWVYALSDDAGAARAEAAGRPGDAGAAAGVPRRASTASSPSPPERSRRSMRPAATRSSGGSAAGRCSAAWRSFPGPSGRRAIAAYVSGAEATGRLLLPERPYGQILGAAPLTAGTWTGFFRRSLGHWLAENGATIAEATGDLAAVAGNALALLEALPERPAKGLAHGDYFPGNVLLDDGLAVSGLVDFSGFTLAGDPLYDAITAALFLEMIEEATADDVALARDLVMTRHGEAILDPGRFYRAYAAILMADPANAAPPYPRLFAWSVANLRALAAGTLAF